MPMHPNDVHQTPQNVGYVELTDHAYQKLGATSGVDENFVVGRIKAGHGQTYYDHKKSQGKGSWEFYWPDQHVAAKTVIEFERLTKVALVLTVFRLDKSKEDRYHTDRFTRWWFD